MLVDTDVLIWHLRGLPKATQTLDRLPRLRISAITYLELLQGLRSGAELRAIQQSLAMRNTERLPLTPAITDRATTMMETLALSHGLLLGDALIAATALEHGLAVFTANVRHFDPVEGLRIERFAPNEE